MQDAGLIFLSRMTTSVAERVLSQGKTPDEAVATALAATALATASLGVALVLLGKLKLARFVAYLPMPVVRRTAARAAVAAMATATTAAAAAVAVEPATAVAAAVTAAVTAVATAARVAIDRLLLPRDFSMASASLRTSQSLAATSPGPTPLDFLETFDASNRSRFRSSTCTS